MADEVNEAVQRLSSAQTHLRPCPPVRDLLGEWDVSRAYMVQERLVEARVAAGARRIGRKIGLTSPVVQRQLGVDQPDCGTLLDTMLVDDRRPVPYGLLLQPRIEAEIAFLLGADIDSPDPTLEEVASSVHSVLPALEIVDSRIADWDIHITDTVADNASSGLFVLGDTPVSLEDVKPGEVSMELRRDGEVVSRGTGSACLGDPLIALQWLARTAVSLGLPLRAGEVVLSGALGPMVSVKPGETYTAHITGLGEVHVVFSPDLDGARR